MEKYILMGKRSTIFGKLDYVVDFCFLDSFLESSTDSKDNVSITDIGKSEIIAM